MEKEISKTNYQKRKEICKTKKFCKISKHWKDNVGDNIMTVKKINK